MPIGRSNRGALGRIALVVAIAALAVVPAASLLSVGSRVGHPGATDVRSGAEAARAGTTTGPRPVLGSNLLDPAAATRHSLLAGLPPTIAHTPWVAALTNPSPSLHPLTSLPNLALLKASPTATGGSVNPFYVAQPAPLGLTDYGLGATTYSYNTSHFLGQVTFRAPPNVTDPGSTNVIEPSGSHDGFVGSVYEFGIQLNTVATHIAIPGSDQGFFWTQNVVNWNDTGIHFVDDTFNLSSATHNPFFIAPGTIYSGCHNSSAGVDVILFNYGGVFQCVGGTIPVSPASYPVTVQLYNNATVNGQNRTQVAYGYRITEAGTGHVYTGVSDVVVFNNPAAPGAAPPNRPGFSVDGFRPAPAGLFRDAEMDLVGDIGGDNAVFRSLSGSVQLEYSNASSGGFRSVPSAYNFGGDTGETSTGIADFWTPGHTLEMNQGPAMLYGLWNAAPWASVKSGSVHLAGSISPSYGFVFVSNTHPVLDPWGTGARDNMSWLPTTNAGTFSTYLPPLGAPWTSKYFVQAFAAGYAEKNGTPVTATTTGYTLTLTPAPGVLRAPLYMFSNAQAANLALRVSGSASAPLDFDGLVVNMNFTFDHLNDFGYPSFVLFMSQGVTTPMHVNNTYQGSDSAAGNFYLLDYAGSTGILVPGPVNTSSLPFFTSGINLYGGSHDVVSNQTLAADGYGLQVVLWDDSDASVTGIVSELQSAGVWNGASTATHVSGVAAVLGGTGVTDIGSRGTVGTDITATGFLPLGAGVAPSLGVEGLSATNGTFSHVRAASGADGVSTGADFGASADYATYYYLPGTTGLTVHDLHATAGSFGANVSLSSATRMGSVSATNGSVGVVTDGATGLAIGTVVASGSSTGVWMFHSRHGAFSQVTAMGNSTGVDLTRSTGVRVAQVAAWNHSTGVRATDSSFLAIAQVFASGHSIGVYDDDSTHLRIGSVTAVNHSVGVYIAS